MPDRPPLVAILLCSYNGAQFIQKQLQSFKEQTYTNWILYVSDDGSTDETLNLIHTFAQSIPQKVVVLSGPKKGFAANFLSLVGNRNIQADYYAYSDQDDIWITTKLECAVNKLEKTKEAPSLYCSRTAYIDENDIVIGYSSKMKRKLSFENALIQCIAGGNTMVFNTKLRRLLNNFEENLPICSHDWWTYIVVTLHDGVIHYTSEPTVLYRQHQANLKGMNTKVKGRVARLKMLFEGRFQRWNKIHLDILQKSVETLDIQKSNTIHHWLQATKDGFFLNRIYHFFKSSVYRQKRLDSFIFFVACLLKRI